VLLQQTTPSSCRICMITDSNTDEILSNRKFLYQPVKVNSQSRNPQDRLLHPYKLLCLRDPMIPLLPCNHPTSYRKIAVKPCVPQSTWNGTCIPVKNCRILSEKIKKTKCKTRGAMVSIEDRRALPELLQHHTTFRWYKKQNTSHLPFHILPKPSILSESEMNQH